MKFKTNSIKHFFYVFFPFLISITSFAQRKKLPKVEIIQSGIKTSLRGLSVVNNDVVWVSGSNGVVGKSTNAGKNWKWITVKGFENKDFRDIEAFDANTAIIMAIEEPAYILKTTDGGESWKIVYENKTKGMFLDAMEFRDVMHGVVIGDPVDGKFFLAETKNGGESWSEIAAAKRPVTDSGEACFASSGTNIRYIYNRSIVFISGGKINFVSKFCIAACMKSFFTDRVPVFATIKRIINTIQPAGYNSFFI